MAVLYCIAEFFLLIPEVMIGWNLVKSHKMKLSVRHWWPTNVARRQPACAHKIELCFQSGEPPTTGHGRFVSWKVREVVRDVFNRWCV